MPRRLGRIRVDPKIVSGWRTLVRTRNPEATCFYAVSRELQARVLPAYHFAHEPLADVRALARALAVPLGRAALAKLARRFSKDAAKSTTRLIRYHPDDALAYLAQAVEWAGELLLRDLEAYPSDRLPARVARLIETVGSTSLPSWKGRRSTWVGRSYDLWLLMTYEAWMAALAVAFPGRDWTDAEPPEREGMLAQYQASGELPGPLTTQLLRAACACRTRETAALTIVAGTAPHARLRPGHLKGVLRKTRPLARRLDRLRP